MPYSVGRRFFPDPDSRREHLQVINAYVRGRMDLTPVSPDPGADLLAAMLPITVGQPVPLIGERVTPDDDPNLLDE